MLLGDREEMSFTDKPARTNPSSILGGLPLAIPIGVMEILLVSMYILQPVHFSVFPSLLLIITLYRLALNVATTRLILLHGSTGEDAAGKVIQSFGQFVVGGNHVVGIVVFLVPMAIQYVVINHGAVRIS